MHRFQHRSSYGQRSGLVEDDCIQVGQALQSFSAFEENSELRAAAHCNCKRGGYGKTHGAGAGDYQHGDGVGQRQRKRVRGKEPGGKGDDSESKYDGHKDCAGAVGQPFHGRARRLRLLDHARDLRQHRGLA